MCRARKKELLLYSSHLASSLNAKKVLCETIYPTTTLFNTIEQMLTKETYIIIDVKWEDIAFV